MRNLVHVARAALGVTLALACSAAPTRAAFDVSLNSAVTVQAGGTYLYTYTLAVASTSTITASEFNVSVLDPTPAGLTAITSPLNFFAFYTPGDSTISFTSFDDGIGVGGSGIFSFVSTLGPVSAPALIRGLNSTNFSTASSSFVVFAPGVVPEPSSFLMGSLGVVGLFGWMRRSSRRAA